MEVIVKVGVAAYLQVLRKRKRAKLSLDPSIVLVVDCNRSLRDQLFRDVND